MKKNFSLIILGSMISLNAFALNADKGGNGGGAHVCYENAAMTKFKSIELYDLYEGRILPPKFQIPAWDGKSTKAQLLDQAITKIENLDLGFANDIRNNLKILSSPDSIADATQVKLELVKDSKQLFVGENCEYVQVVNWQDPEQLLPGSPDVILRNEDLYSKGKHHFDPLSQAALDLHEAAFKTFRTHHDAETLERYGSRTVRKFIAAVFSNAPLTKELADSVSGTPLSSQSLWLGLVPDEKTDGGGRVLLEKRLKSGSCSLEVTVFGNYKQIQGNSNGVFNGDGVWKTHLRRNGAFVLESNCTEGTIGSIQIKNRNGLVLAEMPLNPDTYSHRDDRFQNQLVLRIK